MIIVDCQRVRACVSHSSLQIKLISCFVIFAFSCHSHHVAQCLQAFQLILYSYGITDMYLVFDVNTFDISLSLSRARYQHRSIASWNRFCAWKCSEIRVIKYKFEMSFAWIKLGKVFAL